eukprot:5116979-Amphidinium_carterae.1
MQCRGLVAQQLHFALPSFSSIDERCFGNPFMNHDDATYEDPAACRLTLLPLLTSLDWKPVTGSAYRAASDSTPKADDNNQA